MMKWGFLSVVAAVLVPGMAAAASFAPEPVQPSGLTVRLTEMGGSAPAGTGNNLESPVVSQNAMYVIDKTGTIYRDTGSGFTSVFDLGDTPAGASLVGREAIVNLSPGATGDEVYVMVTSSTLPDPGLPVRRLPAALPGECCGDGTLIPDLYRWRDTVYQVLYRFDVEAGGLTNPEPITALESQTTAHSGGAMVTLPDGRVLFATGDNLTFGLDGRAAPQADDSHLSKLLIIDPSDGAVQVAAKGLRNVQHMQMVEQGGETRIALADIGGIVAEEINTVTLDALLNPTRVENFGWGRAADGQAREGTFYIEPGIARLTDTAAATGAAPVGEAGYEQPYAQFGRSAPGQVLAITGPVFSSTSFDRISFLFSDLGSGALFATTAPAGDRLATVYEVAAVDENGDPVALLDLSLTGRADPRFFRFADGGAGVMLESSGKLYRIDELSVSVPVPLPAGGGLLLAAMAVLASCAWRRARAFS